MYVYNAYGLIIASEISLVGLTMTNGNPDVWVKVGQVPLKLDYPIVHTMYQQITATELLLEIKDVAKFYVHEGKTIIVQPLPHGHAGDIQVFLMGTVFAYVLQYYDYLVLHGSAILINGQAIIFSGDSGAGKSTIAAAFAQKGYTVLTDDMVALKLNDVSKQLELIPGWPRLKLWQDALKHLGETSDGLIPVQNKQDKYEFPIVQSNLNLVPINAFYELNPAETELVTLSYVTDKLKKLDMLVKNTFRYHMLKGLGKRNLHFNQCAILSGKIKITVVSRPKTGYKLDELVTKIESDILGLS